MLKVLAALAVACAVSGCSESSEDYAANACSPPTVATWIDFIPNAADAGRRAAACEQLKARNAAFMQAHKQPAAAPKEELSAEQQQKKLDGLMNNGGWARSMQVQRYNDDVDRYNQATGTPKQCNADGCW